MNESVRYIDEDDVLDKIAERIRKKDYTKACEILINLNAIRMEKGYKPHTLSDIFFLRMGDILPKSENKKNLKCVYIAEFSDESIKIGVSKEPKQRIKNLSFQKGKEIKRYCNTEPVENAFQIEHELHTMFSAYRLKGEYFAVNYEEVLMAVEDKYRLGISVSENIYKRHPMIGG